MAGAVASDLPVLQRAVASVPHERAGVRLHGMPELRPLLASDGPIGRLAASVLGPGTQAVRAILFHKTAATNWALGWHQDRTICVADRIEVAGFGPWTRKRGLHHVAPPFALLSRMLTLRVHLDDVDADNAPLLIAPGSHRMFVPEERVEAVVQACGTAACHAHAGDVWLYATPILHASQAAARPSRRRVLQVDYSAGTLPDGLRWLGV